MKELISMSLEELQLALKKAEAMEIFTASIVLDAEQRLNDARQQNKMYADSVSQLKCLIEAESKSKPKMKIGF